MATPSRPPIARQSSRIPGGFDLDDDFSPIKTSFDDGDVAPSVVPDGHKSWIPQLPEHEAAEALTRPAGEEDSIAENESLLQEKEMRRKLEDLDSTFLQAVSPAGPHQTEISTTELAPVNEASPEANTRRGTRHDGSVAYREPNTEDPFDQDVIGSGQQGPSLGTRHDDPARAPPTAIHDPHINTSSLETMSSSPTAAAAARTVSRAVSMASLDQGYETADDSKGGITLEKDETPTKNEGLTTSTSRSQSPTPTKPPRNLEKEGQDNNRRDDHPEIDSLKSNKRPQYLKNRLASQRSSRSSYTTTFTEGASEDTLGADFALQPGAGGLDISSTLGGRPANFSRSVSLGSVASGISYGDVEDKMPKLLETHLQTLTEEGIPQGTRTSAVPQTPGSPGHSIRTPTDTVIAQHVRDVPIPATLARNFQDRQRQSSPDKRSSIATPAVNRNSKNLTLKEQSTTIDRLVKENFDLKLKITFLDEALNRRSDEGIKAMISENVDLRTAKFKSAKETRELKRSIRDLERRLKEKTDELASKATALADEKNKGDAPNAENFQELEDEVIYLRERVTTYEKDIERIRSENLSQETEKRKFAETVRRFGESAQGGDIGAREEIVSPFLLEDRVRLIFRTGLVEGLTRS